jgi:outer membrane protein TolC
MKRTVVVWSWVYALLLCVPGFAAREGSAATLSLVEAERIALESDPSVQRFAARAGALAERAIADGQLPDPKLKFGLVNLPVDSFSRSQEPMTQLQAGIRQTFPRGKTLAYTARRTESLSAVEAALSEDQARRVLRSVRQAFLNVYFQVHAGVIIHTSREFFTQLVAITQAHYANGLQSQQDVARAQLELSLLDDQATRIVQAEEVARGNLAKWIADQAWQTLAKGFPSLPAVPERDKLKAGLVDHPAMHAEDARLEASRQDVNLALAQYKPGWALDVTYGQRIGRNPDGNSRADLLSALVLVDLPLFVDKRQDRQLAASRQEVMATRYARADRLRELQRVLDDTFARWQRLGDRQGLFEHQLLKEAKLNADASLNAYQSGVSDFTTLMRAILTELDTRLEALRVQVDCAKAQAGLLYLVGERR